MIDSQAKIHDFSFQFKFKDLFLDFLACLVPGFVFVISITLLVGGAIYISISSILFESDDILNIFTVFSNELLRSYTFQFWVTLAIIFISFIVGHLLYRLNPKTPDYASFIRIRKKVVSIKDDWVIPYGFGIISQEVQFPYQNLKRYLLIRGFSHLAAHIFWDSKLNPGQRSKSFINKLKIRISYHFPNKTMHIIRNEAHIRLASSVWYAAKYILKTSYLCILFITISTSLYYYAYLSNNQPYSNSYFFNKTIIPFLKNHEAFLLCSILFLFLVFYLLGFFSKWIPDILMNHWRIKYYSEENMTKPNEEDINIREASANKVSKKILVFFNIYDFAPIATFFLLLTASLFMFYCYYNCSSTFLLRILILYNALSIFILIGVVFVKRRIEETIHYQRVREIIYVLETAFLGDLYKN